MKLNAYFLAQMVIIDTGGIVRTAFVPNTQLQIHAYVFPRLSIADLAKKLK